MDKVLTEQEKLNIMKNVFHHVEEDILYFYIDLADIKIKTGAAKDFWDAAFQIRQEYLDYQKKNPQKKQSVGNFEQQADGLKEIFSEGKEKLDKINNDIDNIFKDIDNDAKNDKNHRKPIDIASIKIIQSKDGRK